jgi:glycosyltransferase involved in cell wall biosynthesis
MKIVYVTIQFPVPSEAFAAVEMRALRRQGADLSVFSYRSSPPKAREMLEDRGLADLPVDHGSAAGTLYGLLLILLRPANTAFLLSLIFRHCWRRPAQVLKALLLLPRTLVLFERVKKLRPDVVHLYWGHYPSLLGLLVRRRLPETLVSQFLGAYDLEEAFPLSGLLTRQGDFLVTLSKANVPPITALGADPQDVRISYHGVDIPTPLPEPQKTRGLMVVAERLVPQKCTEDVIRVFALVRREVPEAQLLVMGDGPAAPRLRQVAAELDLGQSVRFTGHVAHSEVLAQVNRAEVALTMSQSPSERLPNFMKEAMLRRCLCLSSRTAGIEELIDDGETGLIVDLGDVETAAQRLLALLRDSRATAGICARAQARIAADFNVDRLMAERLEQWSMLRQETRTRRVA